MEAHIRLPKRLRGPAVKNTVIIGRRKAYAIKHIDHISYLVDVPIAQILVKGAGVHEHLQHSGHLASIPRSDILVEP